MKSRGGEPINGRNTRPHRNVIVGEIAGHGAQSPKPRRFGRIKPNLLGRLAQRTLPLILVKAVRLAAGKGCEPRRGLERVGACCQQCAKAAAAGVFIAGFVAG